MRTVVGEATIAAVNARTARAAVVVTRLMLVAVAVACLAATIGAWRIAATQAEAERQKVFGELATRTANTLDGRIQAYLEMLHGSRGLFHATNGVTRTDWSRYVGALDVATRHPGTAQLGFIRYVRPEQKGAFESSILEFSPQGVFPSGDRPEYMVMDLVEPAEAQGAIGFDAATDPQQFEALKRARKSGLPAATARLHLPTDEANEPAFLVVLPVYRFGIQPAPSGGPDSLEGFVYAALHVRELLSGVTEDLPQSQITLSIYDVGFNAGATPTEGDLVYADPAASRAIADLSQDRRIEVGGREWVVAFGGLVEPPYDSTRPYFVLGLGVCVSALLIGLVYSVISSRDRAYALADEMTHDLREREAQLAIARDEALAASTAKGEFLASMSHEIRTPLNAILGTAELLARTVLSPEQRRYVDVCRKAGDHLLALLNNVLDLSKVEAGHLVFEAIDFDLDEIVERSSDMMVPRARAKGLEIAYRVAPDVPRRLVGDPHRIGQVLVNLLGNSIKFTSKGSIIVEVERYPAIADGVKFAVVDTGIGIPAAKLDSVFDQFTQVDASTTRKYGGTGLGLAITKSLIELMGGNIKVESQLGRGSTFWFALPLPSAANEGQTAVRRVITGVLDGLTVFAADDNGTNRLILNDTLREGGMVGRVFASGPELLAALSEATDQRHLPDLVIVDGKMPEMDGYTVAARIRAAGMTDVPIMMLTSDLSAGDSDRARRLGIRGQLEKPVRPRELIDAMARILAPESVARTQSLSPDSPLLGRVIRVLIAEDNEDNRMIFEAYLKGEPVEVEFAEDGLVAVLKASQGDYDLILMDMQMPRMDGMEATRRIRASEAQQHSERVPIVALTAHALSEDRTKMLKAGCDDIANKPIRRETLLRFIGDRALVHERQTQRATPRSSGVQHQTISPDGFMANPPPNLHTTVPPDQAAPADPSTRPPAVARQVHRVSPPPLLAPMVPGYLAKRRDDVGWLRALADAEDFESIRVIGHGLKGSGGSFGFAEISRIGAEIEDAAVQQDVAVVLERAAALEEYVENVEIILPKSATPSPSMSPTRAPVSPSAPPSSLAPPPFRPNGREPICVTPVPMLAAMVPAYLNKRRAEVLVLRGHVERGEFEPLRILGHGLKGSGGSFGFAEITRIGGVIESAAIARDGGVALVAISDLQDYLDRVEIVAG